ncbi:unnamed protein product [Malassezia sympodialis ATCC 42132]|uniref:Similar to S.cerevisiae protein RPP2B (Ribosomal protein P2 beta) n=1 Tax=Malassezia sympodialis (strain ATCC 42132) TaxID=1230383 RepID=M5EC80_MALS4|nr:uncharacterized protein MSY001_2945 [Malassezia sympodialis ATCC 42132]CCV00240.1 unnamed protein product [Malassezia sympodialis ATCC 42132]SHO78857.1 Similar to S.cerevisiae protein RPP2B (Ribosomal protein P2 beta) [Malassezia sympodialis ATCC 42132]|eukprot:XP_018741446.1 uncharacterized protein MSY001_2945 [Malassezia sympodialis ATCC 42132]
MKHIAAFLLLSLAKESAPTADDVKGLLSTVGIEADAERLDKLVAELDGKNVADVIAEGKEKLASVPSGGAVAAAPAAGGAAAGGDEAPAAEEKKEEEKEESDDDMGFGLFD